LIIVEKSIIEFTFVILEPITHQSWLCLKNPQKTKLRFANDESRSNGGPATLTVAVA
jgi:hypothetical protein